jgi:argininosuccinate lyase
MWGCFLMVNYRKAGIRLTEDSRQEMKDAAYPGPGISRDGCYARRKQQLKAVHMFDLAHTVMLACQGIISKDTASSIFLESW